MSGLNDDSTGSRKTSCLDSMAIATISQVKLGCAQLLHLTINLIPIFTGGSEHLMRFDNTMLQIRIIIVAPTDELHVVGAYAPILDHFNLRRR